MLSSKRKWAILISFIIAAMVTSSDFFLCLCSFADDNSL
ncbi:hypothetical protein [Bartonella bovis]